MSARVHGGTPAIVGTQQIKRDAGIPTRDYRQEKDVVERARAAAVDHGLSPALGEELILALIRGSLTIQEKDTVATKGEGSGRRDYLTTHLKRVASLSAVNHSFVMRGRHRM